MSEDIRVILIKIADRLHNMRTLGSQAKNKQYKIAGETLYIYAPLANRLGLNSVKTELEDLSFRYEYPAEYDAIEQKLASTEAERNTVFSEFTAPIRESLDAQGYRYEIKARVKTPYSIWKKMQTKHVTFEEIYDILAVRIIFDPTNPLEERDECFDIYVMMSKIYKAHPERLRDWVSYPKANGYQALHVTLMSKQGEWIEVQIRSRRMDDIAEKGFAAHWKYKETTPQLDSESELNKWLNTIKEILDDPQPDAMDFLDTIKLNLFASEIFVFTPKGEIRTLPAGSTALDFAFSIHTVVGSHCIGAKVNHKLVSISHKLKSGDQVEILTSKQQRVERSWLNIATTAKATTKIVAILRKQDREARKLGEDLLTDFLKKHDMVRNTATIDKLCRLHHMERPEMLFTAIGDKHIKLGDADLDYLREKTNSGGWKRLFSFGRKSKNGKEKKIEKFVVDKNFDRKKVLQLTESTIQTKYTLSECCKPIPGDPVMGFIDDQNHIVIHKLQCPIAARLKANRGNRVLAAQWSMGRTMLFPVEILIEGLDKMGLLNKMTQVISEQLNVNMHKLVVECNDGIFECHISLFVYDTTQVDTLISNLRQLPDITSVSRI